ncbi:hypothetical protein M378DRAFT_168983 [Amanita muscaria Koide BX008]|uniref:Uncharacterized protein n=1 Tax=Amanita muscaria (strain Koide BX008) TaxID=946122 RepID=A0A0C2SZX0_AMAMK|nr:hypothetical protein M378DRAFT_168983 [Amanita muscaria Koide BX008]
MGNTGSQKMPLTSGNDHSAFLFPTIIGQLRQIRLVAPSSTIFISVETTCRRTILASEFVFFADSYYPDRIITH